MRKNRPYKRIITLIALLMLLVTTGLSGCRGGSSGSGESGDGEVSIGLTDATGDFVTYTVDILSLTLSKKNGAVVETLPLSTGIDFSRYVDMTEFLTAATVPSGVYTAATMTLDYGNADIRVENDQGDAVQVETIQDETGTPVTTLQVSVILENNKSLVVAPGVPAHLVLDFDLSASNTVAFDEGGAPILTVDPTLIADINPENPKPHRLRGPLAKVDTDNNSFSVIIRPFRHTLSHHTAPFGTMKVITDDETTYDINGQSYLGADGLAAMGGLPPFSAVIVIGDLKFKPYRFEADEVFAGSSVPGGDQDAVTGNVYSRADDTLMVKGASLFRQGGSVTFNDEMTVLLGENTEVRRLYSTDEYTTGDISIGQRITAFGVLTQDESHQWTLDAADGSITLMLTTLRGTVVEADAVSADDTPLVIDLQSIDRRRSDIFDFEAVGADPAAYEINTDGLDISTLAAGDPVRVLGFVSPYDQETPDFYAHTIIDVSAVKSVMKVHWMPASLDAFTQLSEDRMVLNLEGVGLFHYINTGGVILDLTGLSDSPVIQPEDDGPGIFSITGKGPVSIYTDFADFVEDLSNRLAGGAAVKKVDAVGGFDPETATLTSNNVRVHLRF